MEVISETAEVVDGGRKEEETCVVEALNG